MKEFSGLNFGSQDYLNLSTHPEVVDAAIKAIQDYGVHSSGSGILMGNTDISIKLENAISDHLQATDTQLFPTGWGAGFGVVSGLVRPDDHVVLDVFAHSCLQEGAMASTKNVHRFRHLDNDDLRRVLSTIRASDTANAVMVITEGLFSMHADAPDLRTVQDLCHEFDATLVVDVAHDLGSTGPGGTGQIGIQGMVGKIDIVMGSFSKTFASNGGFVATKSRSLRNFIQVFASTTLFTNALSPSQAAAICASLSIVRSPEGERLRQSLASVSNHIHEHLKRHGLTVHGIGGPIAPVSVGNEAAGRLVCSLLPSNGILANLAEYPVVPKNDSRIRLQMMASHTEDDVSRLATTLRSAVDEANEVLQFRPGTVV
ncbi:aminotransferase class I/II-fold pyridoxal phosphate-dependent enzyme [Aurantimonas sp. Leaf443]|uniref:aminotransferase class I/II-fold pyridoxal phosphate-dependent enzyme n=1 Tax=Aurantimonas sp. Leaf443 TaxID=1736378 RepID=UPI00138EFDE0|nr:aminotransferase class I/II-fold pyridoxal phosphate-dependent enzyme [Aurantimonas sp. Leaf443]